MTHPGTPISRRSLLARTGLASAALVGAAVGESVVAAGEAGADGAGPDTSGVAVPFRGVHQAGIATPVQQRLVFAAFDVTGGGPQDVRDLLRAWTAAADRLTAGLPLAGGQAEFAPPVDTGEALGLGPSRLTLTVGFGPSLFDERFGLGSRRPAALEPLPAFAGEQLDRARSDGDLCVQACADDPQVAFHAVRALARLGFGTVALRYVQLGFGRTSGGAGGGGGTTPRNLLGFKDGTANLHVDDPATLDAHVWVGGETDQAWMRGGTYLVARRIRIHLEQWDRSTLDDQQQTVGRTKDAGAPLGTTGEFAPLGLDRLAPDGEPVIPTSAHVRQAAPQTNHGAALLRRGYNFADGIDAATGEFDAGLFFICFQKDPRSQFSVIQQRLSTEDALGEYLLHTASGLFACPPGLSEDGHWGDALF